MSTALKKVWSWNLYLRRHQKCNHLDWVYLYFFLNIKQFSNDIVIYSQFIHGNPLKSKRVVRYILKSTEKQSHRGKSEATIEMRVAYCQDLAENSNELILTTPMIQFSTDNSNAARDDQSKTQQNTKELTINEYHSQLKIFIELTQNIQAK